MKLKIMTAPYLSEGLARTVHQDFHQELRGMYLLFLKRVAASQYEKPLLLITPMRGKFFIHRPYSDIDK